MENIIILSVLIAIAALLVWSGVRAYRIQNSFLKWSGVGLAAVLADLVSSVNAVTIAGIVKQHGRSAPVPDLKVEATPERISRGKALADGYCSGCHSKTGTLTGGADIGQEIPIPVGSFVSSNLTPAGRVKIWSDGEIFRAIRNGIDADGRWLAMMSYTNSGRLSDEDTKALIAYIRSLPAAGEQSPNPPDQFTLLGVAMLGAGHAGEWQAGGHRHRHGPAEGADFSIRRIHPLVSALPRVPRRAVDWRRAGADGAAGT